MDRSQDTEMRECQICGVVVIGHFSCKKCSDTCRVRCGHLMYKEERIDNNWDKMKCKYCGEIDFTQCKNVITE